MSRNEGKNLPGGGVAIFVRGGVEGTGGLVGCPEISDPSPNRSPVLSPTTLWFIGVD